MRFIVSVLFFLLIGVAGCNPANSIRSMRENARQRQNENNQIQIKKALENYNSSYEGLDNGEKRSSNSNKP